MNIRQLWIGVDWGTHSSKWWCTVQTTSGKRFQPTRLPSVVDSTIYRIADDLVISRERARVRRDVADPRLKRLLLTDPQGASYWDAIREGIGISLGDAAALTITCMLGDLRSYLAEEDFHITPSTELQVRFSLPNWIGADSEHQAARRRMYQTSVVSVGLVKLLGWDNLPGIGTKTSIGEWRGTVERVRNLGVVAELMKAVPSTFANMVEREFAMDGMSWRLAAESSAAGYLPLEYLLETVPKSAITQKHWVKLLVIDVGAGSTDAGYFISSRRLDHDELLLNYLPPARTFDYAGEQLTEMLRDFYLRSSNKDLSIEEAETIKVTAPDTWIGQQFVKDWRDRIARSVAEYMFRVPDEARLEEPAIPGLKIVLTGGSGIVLGLDDAVKEAVKDALARRGVPGAVAARTEVVQPRSPIPDRVDAARRAVSTGAAQSDFASLAYREGFIKTSVKVVAPRSWV